MNPAQECLYDVAWQTRRLSYVNTWTNEEQVRTNISDMLSYIGRAQGRYWKFVRVWRCRNVVNHALRNAEMHENTVGIKLIKTFQKGLEIEYNRYRDSRVGVLFKPWNWKKVQEDLALLFMNDKDVYKRLQVYAEARLYYGGKQRQTDPLATPELARFVRTMRDVVFDA